MTVLTLWSSTSCLSSLITLWRSLLYPRQWWRSIVMAKPRIWSLPNFCACWLWPWLGPLPARWRNSKGNGQFWGFSSPLTMHCNVLAAKEIIWIIGSAITSCSRRDHSIASMFTVNGIGREGGDGNAQHGPNVIYDCLLRFANGSRLPSPTTSCSMFQME